MGDARIVQSAIFVCMSHVRTHLPSEPSMPASPAVSSGTLTSSRRPRGFTLVELLIATVVLAVGLLALTSAGGAIVKLGARGQQLARIAVAASSRLELLRSQGCGAASGASDSGALPERWSVMPSAARTRTIVDSVTRDGAGGGAPRSVYVFESALRC